MENIIVRGKKHEFIITEDMIRWAEEIGSDTRENIEKYDIFDAGLLIDAYNMTHNKPCLVYKKEIKTESGETITDEVVDTIYENYEMAKERELSEQEKISLLDTEINDPIMKG